MATYSVRGNHSDVNSEVYDPHQTYEIDKTKIKMLVPLDMNNQRILNSPDIVPNNFVYNKGRIISDRSVNSFFRPNEEDVFKFPVMMQTIIYKFDNDINSKLTIDLKTVGLGTNYRIEVNNLKANTYYKYDFPPYFITTTLRIITFSAKVNGEIIVTGIKS